MNPTKTVLCPIDFSPLSRRSLRLAVETCRRLGYRLVLEHNIDGSPPNFLSVGWMYAEEHESKAKDKSEEAIQRLQAVFEEIPEGVEYEAKITHGPVDAGILYLAKNLPADLIVMGTHGPSSSEHKSLTERIVLRAPCTVLTTGESYDPDSVFGVEGAPDPADMGILLPFDFTSRSRAVLGFGLAMAQRMPHRFHLLHVLPPMPGVHGEPQSAAAAEELRQRLDELVPEHLAHRVVTKVVVGDPVPKILEEAKATKALFILMAAQAKGVFKNFLFGTTTLGVLHGSECPVWFIPPAVGRAL
jgi:nucleotide-binding universal stress UspA family protein